MSDYNVIDVDVFDKVEVDNIENKSEEEIKQEMRKKKTLKAIKIMLFALMGAAFARLTYKPSNAKEKNTDYLDRF